MVTVGELLKHHKPGIIFGAIVGFAISLYLETLAFTNEFMVRIIEWNIASNGFFIIGVFSLIGGLFQRWQRW